MTQNNQQSPDRILELDESDQSSKYENECFPRRSLLQGVAGVAMGRLALPAATAMAASNATTKVADVLAATHDSSQSFSYSLEQAEPQVYAGGTSRQATSANIAQLSGLSVISLRVSPGAMREIHWHPNASELIYCLSGQGEVGIFLSGDTADIFAIQQGSVAFVPIGAAHYIRNTGSDVLHLISGFTSETPSHIDLSDTFGYIPRAWLAQDFELSTEYGFPPLPQQSDQVLVNVGPVSLGPTSSSGRYTADINKIPPTTFDGGTITTVSPQFLPALDGITMLYLQGKPGAFREPHWHPNSAELGYVVQGNAVIEIFGPNEQRESFVAKPGDIAFVPTNFLHLVSVSQDSPLTLINFFAVTAPTRIDFSQLMSTLPRPLIAASFGSNLHIFDQLPNLGDTVLTAKRT